MHDKIKKSSVFLVILIIVMIASNIFGSNLQTYKKYGKKSPVCTPLLEAGIGAFDKKNYSVAFNFFDQAKSKGCHDGLVYYNLGIYYESIDDLGKARKYFELAKKYLYPRYRSQKAAKTIHEDLGRVLYTVGDINGAKKELEQSVKVQGENFTLMFLLGSIAKQENNDSKIIEYYTKALTYEPPSGTNPKEIMLTLLVEIGTSYYKLAQYDKSLTIWNQVLGIAPGHSIAMQYRDNIQRMKIKELREKEEKRILEQIVQ